MDVVSSSVGIDASAGRKPKGSDAQGLWTVRFNTEDMVRPRIGLAKAAVLLIFTAIGGYK